MKLGKMGYKVVATYSPGNKKHGEWLAEMKQQGYDFQAVPVDVADFDSCQKAVAQISQRRRPGRHAGQQRRHHPRHDVPENGPRPTGTP